VPHWLDIYFGTRILNGFSNDAWFPLNWTVFDCIAFRTRSSFFCSLVPD